MFGLDVNQSIMEVSILTLKEGHICYVISSIGMFIESEKLPLQAGVALFHKLPEFIRIELNSNNFKNGLQRLLLSKSFAL